METLKSTLKFIVLYTVRALGGFTICRFLTSNALRILCYHGGALEDEHHFNPGTFMTAATFGKRMDFLKRKGYPVVDLQTAMRGQASKTLPKCAVVITIDDGWYGTYSELFPVLHELNFPATLYVTSYYVEKQTQVFEVLLSYLLWRHSERSLDLAEVHPGLSGVFDLADAQARLNAHALITEYADGSLDVDERQFLVERVGRLLGHDMERARQERQFALVNDDEIRTMAAAGIDIQLHTHRHNLPAQSCDEMQSELRQNADYLTGLSTTPLVHFCYPSGQYTAHQIPWLEAIGIETATTTNHGFNYRETPKLELKRFLDKESTTQIEFEAELSGFFEFLRRIGIKGSS